MWKLNDGLWGWVGLFVGSIIFYAISVVYINIKKYTAHNTVLLLMHENNRKKEWERE